MPVDMPSKYELFDMIFDTIEDPNWFDAPNDSLEGKTPREMIGDGRYDKVLEMINKLEASSGPVL